MSNPAVTQKPGPIASFEAVRAAADALAAEGVTPSVRSVTAKIGGGSPNTVSMHLRQWREQRPAVEAQRRIVLDERIHDLLATQIADAVATATRTATEERDARADDLAEVEQRAAALENQLDQAETRVAELTDRVQHQGGQLEALRAELDAARADSAASIQQAKAEAAAAVQQAKTDAIAAIQNAQNEAAKRVEMAEAEAAAEQKKRDELARQLGAAQEQAIEAERLRVKLAEALEAREKEHAGRVDAEKRLAVTEAKAKAVDGLSAQVETLREKLGTAEIEAARSKAQADERAEALLALREQMKKPPGRPTAAERTKAKG